LIEDVALEGLLPPPSPTTVQPAIVLPVMEPTVPDPPPQATTVAPSTAEAAKAGAYSIVVASFESPTRADRLVEELASAGYRAQTVELDPGPTRPHVHQVIVGGFGSAIEVERALQHIRELPGRYTDAKIVER
jgi:cell division septation protein DedD